MYLEIVQNSDFAQIFKIFSLAYLIPFFSSGTIVHLHVIHACYAAQYVKASITLTSRYVRFYCVNCQKKLYISSPPLLHPQIDIASTTFLTTQFPPTEVPKYCNPPKDK